MKIDDSERDKINKKAKAEYKKELQRIKIKEAKAQAKYDNKNIIGKILSWFGIDV